MHKPGAGACVIRRGAAERGKAGRSEAVESPVLKGPSFEAV